VTYLGRNFQSLHLFDLTLDARADRLKSHCRILRRLVYRNLRYSKIITWFFTARVKLNALGYLSFEELTSEVVLHCRNNFAGSVKA